MAYSTLDDIKFAPATNVEGGPAVPEDRFAFELIGLEPAPPGGPRTSPGVKWIFALYDREGARFMSPIDGSPYEFYRTTGLSLGPRSNARVYAEALLGRVLEQDEQLNPRALMGKRFSAMVLHRKSQLDATKTVADLASFRPATSPADPPAPIAVPKPVPAADRNALRAEIKSVLGGARLDGIESADVAWADYQKTGDDLSDRQLADLLDQLKKTLQAPA